MPDEAQWWFCHETALPVTRITVDRHGRYPPSVTIGGQLIRLVPDENGHTVTYNHADRWLSVRCVKPPQHGQWNNHPPVLDRIPRFGTPEGEP
ncbi:hypothetical protein [Nocardia asiatica]|uniref:hypothetical protein n=1 Tax=Nocardia asiatica TaxID=209252 RepID=UPI0024582B56|nr:hypothetical protein [Nocardia asiatica]